MAKKKNVSQIFITAVLIITAISSCTDSVKDSDQFVRHYHDTTFIQEYHIGHRISESIEENDVRAVAVDSSQNIWVATKGGIFVKENNNNKWIRVLNKNESGPAYSICADSSNTIWFSTWMGVYKYKDGNYSRITAIPAPVTKILSVGDYVYVLGYHGVWSIRKDRPEKKDLIISKGIRDAIPEESNALWIATDAGLYHYDQSELSLYQDTTELISCYTTSVAEDRNDHIWVGGLGGVTVRSNNKKIRTIRAADGLPSEEVNTLERSPDGSMWIGTNMGIVRFNPDGNHSLRFSSRWLMSNKVRDIKFDSEGTAWIATSAGVSAIKKKEMTLAQKERFFYNELLKRHVREPWIVHRVGLKVKGDSSSWYPLDDDNDGEYTGIYLAMESLRYAATNDDDAKMKAKKAFHTLKFFQEVTETDGFFARTVVPVEWKSMNDPNRTYTEREYVDELAKDPRFKRVENRWRKSKDGRWMWKGDTSSDEMCGHFMSYYYFYQFAADEEDKIVLRQHIKKIMDYVIKHNYNFVDIDGKPTRWAVWSPDKLNRDPDWASERSLNSFEILAFLKFTFYATGDKKYQNEYLHLIKNENYLDNAAMLNRKNPAWEIYFDIPMAGYLFPLLIKCEEDPELKLFYENLMDEWFEKQISGNNPLNNFIYCYTRDKRAEIAPSIEFLIDTPLDLVDWLIDHTKREDVRIVRKPILEEKQVDELPPASERAAVRWDKNPWAAVHGSSYAIREPVFWLFPYWMGRYLDIIKE